MYRIGTSSRRQPVGRSWSQASGISWGAATVTTVDASSFVPGAAVRNGATTCFVIPELKAGEVEDFEDVEGDVARTE